MPVNKNAVIRYKFLDNYLSDRLHQYSMDDITGKMNERLKDLGYPPIVKRTLEKDVVFLQERPFCAPIERYRSGGKNCIRYSNSTYSIFHHDMTKEEMSLLFELLNALGEFKGLPKFEWLEALRDRLGLATHKQVLSFSHLPFLKDSNILAAMYECISNKKVLELCYKNRNCNETESYTLHPYLLKEYNHSWFLTGWCANRNRIVSLSIDRILDFKHLDHEKFVDYDGEIEEYFANTIGVTLSDDIEPEEIVFWADTDTAEQICCQPIHHSLKMVRGEKEQLLQQYHLPENGEIFKLFCTLNLELQQEFIRKFDQLIVLQPERLRQEMEKKIYRMAENYRDLEE